jgi:diguanylate cyclase
MIDNDATNCQSLPLAGLPAAGGLPSAPTQAEEGLWTVIQTMTRLLGEGGSGVAPTRGQPTWEGLLTQVESAMALTRRVGEVFENVSTRLIEAETRVQEKSLLIEAHAAEARTDSLTGLSNRRAFDDELVRCTTEVQVTGAPLSLILADIDRFKLLNDSHGHSVGDAVLRAVAALLRKSMRMGDLVARYGGEELAVVIMGSGVEEAALAAERFRKAVEQASFRFDGLSLNVSVSCGVAQALPKEHATCLVQRSDAALYSSKQNGRNQTQVHDGSNIRPFAGNRSGATPSREEQSTDLELGSSEIEMVSQGTLPLAGSRRRKHLGWAGAGRGNWCDAATLFWFLRQKLAETRRGGDPFCLILIEVDGFESIVEALGPNAAELIERTQTHFLDVQFREMDVLAQRGRARTAIVLPRARLADLEIALRRVLKGVREYAFCLKGQVVEYTVSIGCTDVRVEDDPQSIMARAERALQAARGSGGDSISVIGPQELPAPAAH